MAKSIKLGTQLALTDSGSKNYKNALTNNSKFFANNQGSFRGEIKTYDPRPGTIDVPSHRNTVRVVTTVDEKLDYFVDSTKEYFKALFSQEKTNASGKAKAELVVDGTSWGEYSSNELLRLKSILEDGSFTDLINNIPVRSDSEIWEVSNVPMYSGREGIFQSKSQESINKTTRKEQYILADPNLANLQNKTYTPAVASRDIVDELGEMTMQKFSGEYFQYQKAYILKRREILRNAVIKALKEANEVDALESTLDAQKIFGYLFNKDYK